MATLQAVRQRLGQRYLDGLRGMHRSLLELQLAVQSGDAGAGLRIRRLAHQLRGSGTAYGYPDITAAAGEVEELPEESPFDDALTALLDAIQAAAPPITGRVLIIEDDDAQRAMLADGLRAFEVRSVSSLADARLRIREGSTDIVLLDLTLTDGDGRQLLTELHQDPPTLRPPVIVLTANPKSSVIAECLALGADQFLTKPIDVDVVCAVVSAILTRHRQQQREARVDPLTELPNRAGFAELYRRARARADRTEAPLCLGMIDLDGFKAVNDQFGHRAGDAILVGVAATLEASVRATDAVGRWGGDEFVVLIEAELDDATQLLAARRTVLLDSAPMLEGTILPAAEFSAGVVLTTKGEELDHGLARADVLLYQAKALGTHAVLCRAPTSCGPRVLIVEDDLAIAAPLGIALAEAGLEADHVSHAASVPDAASYAVVILDLSLPDAHGLDLLTQLRATSPTLPVLVLTASRDDADLERAYAAGVEDFVQKPASTRSIVVRILRLLKERTSRGDPEDRARKP